MNVGEAVASRRSVRDFLETLVEPVLLRRLVEQAAGAPSGGNLQPWVIHVVTGDGLARLKAIMAERVQAEPGGEGTEYDVYPTEAVPGYRERSFAIGELLYASLAIPREDKAARRAWFARNYQFFGAPVGLFCFIDRRAGPPQWSDCGMYLQTLMLLLREAGLDSCAQECWARYHRTIAGFVGAPAEQMLFTGMAIGWRDPDAPANRLVPPRLPLAEFARFHDGGDQP